MNKLFLSLFALLLAASSVACTPNQRAKKFGGTMTHELPVGRKLVNATWKDNSLWVLHREMLPSEKPEQLVFEESSKFGIVEGKVVIVEKR